MNLFFWKKNKAIDSFASELASELFSAVDTATVRAYFEQGTDKKLAKDKKAARKQAKVMDTCMQGMIKKIREFKSVNSLGVYGKARLHLKFKMRLEELGYDSSLVNKINEAVMLKTP